MIRLAQNRIFSGTLKARQREVEERLAQFGLLAGPYRVVRKSVAGEENKIVRLRSVLETLGPVFCSFGLYMSGRADLLTAKACDQLASLTSHGPELSITAVRDQIRRELGCNLEEVYRDFNTKPSVAGLLVQQHSAWLHDGLVVTVKLISPEVEELVYYDAQLLPLLKGAFVSCDCTSMQVESAIQDFILTLQQHTDFLLHANAISKLEKDMEAFGMLRVPSVQRQLTTSRVLTVERLPGQTLKQILDEQTDGSGSRLNDDERSTLAHRLCVVWLRQSLLGSVFPVEPTQASITVLPNNQIAFTEGALASLTVQAKAHLSDYMLAALADNPDRACSSLLKEMVAEDQALSDVELRRRFRQLVPFRDSDCTCSDNNNLGEYVLMHWRLMHRCGYAPRPHVASFYRGLSMLTRLSRELTSEGDPLQQAMQDVRVLAETERLREMLTASHFTEQIDAYLAFMMHLPQRLDQALTVIARREVRAGLQVEEGNQNGKKKGTQAVDVALWLMLGASVLLVQHFEIGLTAHRGGRFDIVVFVLAGALVLVLINRRH